MRCAKPSMCAVLAMMTVATQAVPAEAVGSGGSEAPAGERLSILETCGAVVSTPIEGSVVNLHSRASPDAKAAIWALLANKAALRYHPNAWYVLGYVGDAADADRIERFVHSGLSGVVTEEEKTSVEAAFVALALMCRRDIAKAQTAMDRMSSRAYWTDVRSRWHWTSARLDFELDAPARVLKAYSFSEQGDLADRVSGLLGAINDSGDRARVRAMLNTERLMRNAKRLRQSETTSIPPYARKVVAEQGKRHWRLFGEALKEDVRDLESLRGIVKEAMAEYDKVRAAVLARDFESLSARLLEDGRELDPRKRDRLLEEYQNDLRRERDVFRLMDMDYVKPANFKVERAVANTFSSLDANDQPRGLKTEETISVTYDLEGTTAVGISQFRRLRGTLTVAGDGTLIVMMKKLNGKWYWNPFGWGVKTPGEAPTVLLGIAPGPDSGRHRGAPMTDDKVEARVANGTRAAPYGHSAGVTQTVLVLSVGVLLGAALAWFLLTRKSTRTAGQRKS